MQGITNVKEALEVIKSSKEIAKKLNKAQSLKAETAQKFINSIEFKQADVNYLVIIAVYLGFELLVLLFLKELNKQIEFEQKAVKRIKQQEKTKTKPIKQKPKENTEEQKPEESLKYLGSYIEYAKANNISRNEAKELFNNWKKQNLLITKDRKKYLKEA